MIQVLLEAPFAACRTFTAGWYRPTATFLTPSAAYGLLLNAAGIESRVREEEAEHDGSVPSSTMRSGLPSVELDIGVPTHNHQGAVIPRADQFPRTQSIFQQLHNYPVGTTGKERAESCRGNKYNITPVRREFLSDLRAIIALRGNSDLEERVARGLRGEFNQGRYGIPYIGDNAFLLDRFELLAEPQKACWFERIGEESPGIRYHATRLTITIDRSDLSRTRSDLFAPANDATLTPPAAAWVRIEWPELTREVSTPRRERK